jgi:small conductance mechanosensitive channel
MESLNLDLLGPFALAWAGRIAAAILVFVIGRWVAMALTAWITKAVARAGVDETLRRFFRSVIYMTLMVFVILSAVSALGVPTTSFLAIVGAAGLAGGLALKDSLANFSSGVMLVFFRPFKVGDYVEAGGVAGTVDSIGIFNTVVKTPDNRVITVPNSLIYGGTITNYSAEATRRIDLVIGIGYDDDVALAKSLIEGVLKADSRVLDEPPPALMLLELGDSSVNIAVRPWVKSADYWAVRADVLERCKHALEENGLSIPYPQRDVHIIGQTGS